MAESTISVQTSGNDKDNEQTRRLTDFSGFAFNADCKRFIRLERVGGIWCSCGGTSQRVDMDAYDQLLDGTTVIKTSSTDQAKCYGYGPNKGSGGSTDNEVNYAKTVFDNFTKEESQAAISAWEKGTLTVMRFVTITYATSSSHGQPTFRDGQYVENISVTYDDTPLTNYKPVIEYFRTYRSDDGISEKLNSTTVYCKVRINFTDIDGALAANPVLNLGYSYLENGATKTVDYNVPSSKFQMVSSNVGIDVTFELDETFSAGTNYNFTLNLSAGEEVATPFASKVMRYGVPWSIGKNNSGFATGMVSNATPENPMFECAYPAYFYESVDFTVTPTVGGNPLGGSGITAGVVPVTTIAKNSCIIKHINFGKKIQNAIVLCTPIADRDNMHYYIGDIACVVIDGSITEDGFDYSIVNRNGTARNAGMSWIAIGG